MFEKVNIQDLKFNPFDEISNHWVLISAKKEGVVHHCKQVTEVLLENRDISIKCRSSRHFIPFFMKYRKCG